jgi:pilus assembly protein Flp/PilA
MLALVEALARSRSGATVIEYGLIAALVAIAAMVGMGLMGSSLNAIFTLVGNTISSTAPQ